MLDISTFKQVMGQFPTGVTVITCSDGNGGITGLTASSFTSVSIEPPLVLFCPQYDADSYAALDEQKSFAIHILEETQSDIAYAFAGKGTDKVKGIGFHISARGIPVLDNYLALMECCLYQNYQGGDHAIMVAEVLHTDLVNPEQRLPLAYCRGKIGTLVEIDALLRTK